MKEDEWKGGSEGAREEARDSSELLRYRIQTLLSDGLLIEYDRLID